MLCFIMPLKSKTTSNNWEQVCALCEYSMNSIFNQTDPNFKAVLVCHDVPKWSCRFDSRLEIITVDWTPSAKWAANVTMNDKLAKVQYGLMHAEKLKPAFLMIVDADDLVSRQLSQYANSNKEANGWIFENGFRWEYGSNWVFCINDNFHQRCGTSAIVNWKLVKSSKNMNTQNISDCIVLRSGHTMIKQNLLELGTPLLSLPFPGGIHVKGHGDNDSDLKKMERTQNIRLSIKTLSRLLNPRRHMYLLNYRPLTHAGRGLSNIRSCDRLRLRCRGPSVIKG